MTKISLALLLCIIFLSCTNKPVAVENKHINQDTSVAIDISCVPVEFLLGQTNERPETFVEVSSAWSDRKIYMDSVAYNSFQEMAEAARVDGINLVIISGYRSFNYQKIIWDRKWEANKDLSDSLKVLKILEFSSMPGISRHHWGTDIDLNSLENDYFENGYGLKVYNWLVDNAMAYGFFQPYTNKNGGRSGFEEEKWHWSYFPLADNYLYCYSIDTNVKDYVEGFKGSEYYLKLNILEDYVMGVSQH